MKVIHIVADYASGDLAFAEIISALSHHLPDDWRWHHTSVGSFETITTGFIVAQLGLQSRELRAEHTIVYANCAPRKDRTEARQSNEGEGLLYGVLTNGVSVVIVNSGYSLSFIRDDLKELWSTTAQKGGSQFRSRDTFPPVVGKVARGELDFRKEKLDPHAVIPEPPSGVVGYVDSFGNLKTTFRARDNMLSKLTPGQRITARINNVTRSLQVATGSFNVHEGEIALAPGSSGHENRYWEIFQRGGNAWATFGKPNVGADITLELEA